MQAFSHFIPFPNGFARQMDSPAARQMLWQHYDKDTGKIGVAPERTEFLAALERLGGWPMIPRKIAVANGRADGTGLPDVTPGETALRIERIYPGTTFYTQAQGDDTTVAYLNLRFPKAEKTITTDGFPELDGAPGGTLHTYKILAETWRSSAARRTCGTRTCASSPRSVRSRCATSTSRRPCTAASTKPTRRKHAWPVGDRSARRRSHLPAPAVTSVGEPRYHSDDQDLLLERVAQHQWNRH